MLVNKLKILAFLLLAAALVQAQTSKAPASAGSVAQAAEAEKEANQTDSNSTAVAAPAHPGAEGPQLAVESDPEYKNVLVGNVMGSAAYDSNAGASVNPTKKYVSDVRFAVQPSLAFQHARKTADITLSYTPGFSVSQHNNSDYQFTQNAGGEFAWHPSSRFRLHMRQDYTKTTNPFESLGREPLLSNLGGFAGPTSNNLLPNSERELLASNADIMFRLSPHGAIGLTGGYRKNDYGAAPGDTIPTLTASHTYLGTAYYSLQVSRTNTIGVQAAIFDIFSEMQIAPYITRTQLYDAQLFDTWKMTARSTLTLYAGPEYSRDFITGGYTKHVRPQGGATYAWNGVKNALTLDYVRRTSDGGGLMGSALTNHGVAALRSRLSRSWGIEERLEASDQKGFGGLADYRSYWAGAAVTRDLGRHFLFRLDYARVRQFVDESAGLRGDQKALLSYATGNHNLVQFTLDYHFIKPVGR